MKLLYLDCGMGAAGDMLSAALYELLDDKQKQQFMNIINSLNIPNTFVETKKVTKCGIEGTHFMVLIDGVEEDNHHSHEHDHSHEHTHDHEHTPDHEHTHSHEHTHPHSSISDISSIINALPVSNTVKVNALSVYKLIAEAEGSVHGKPINDIHFHEVGTIDAVIDVTSVCLLLEMLNVEKIIASPIHVGSGQVKCAHGILPVPAPATAHILKNVPIYSKDIKGELCTPTGAALLKHFVSEYKEMPIMCVQQIGYGMGRKDFPVANCVRAFIGEVKNDTNDNHIVELFCNIDDMSAENIAFASERILEAGAVDVYSVPITMKKSRPGVILGVMCHEADRELILQTIFKHTSTIGVRESISKRYTLTREIKTINSPIGQVRLKYSEGYGVSREKYEYDDLAALAKQHDLSIEEILKIISSNISVKDKTE